MAETPAEKRRRLRWLTLAELIGVLALLISAASFWDSHRDHERATTAPAAARIPLLLVATGAGETLTLKPARGDAVVQTQRLVFPAGVLAEPVEATGAARIEAGAIGEGIRTAVPASADAHPPRLPVGIVTSYDDGGVRHGDVAIYDIGYTLHDRLLRPRAVELEGITLVGHVPETGLAAAVTARWTRATHR